MSIKVMLADDHILMREGIRQLLEFDGSIDVVAEANDGEECIEKLLLAKPQILLLDINMPKKNGLEVLKSLKSKKSKLKVLVLTVHNDIGVNGYVLKDSESAELKKAIFTVAEGESYIQPSLIPALNAKMIETNKDAEKIDSLISDFSATSEELLASIESVLESMSEIANATYEGAQGTTSIASKTTDVKYQTDIVSEEVDKCDSTAKRLNQEISVFIVE